MHGWLKKRLGSLSLIPMAVVLALSLFLPAHTADESGYQVEKLLDHVR